jgi:hypothetical protein
MMVLTRLSPKIYVATARSKHKTKNTKGETLVCLNDHLKTKHMANSKV